MAQVLSCASVPKVLRPLMSRRKWVGIPTPPTAGFHGTIRMNLPIEYVAMDLLMPVATVTGTKPFLALTPKPLLTKEKTP
jgi:hypothetical protein